MHAFTEDRRHHHIIDPRTGRSPEATSSVTVLAPTAMLADALSTALLVLGPGKGREALSGFQGAEGLWVTKDGIRIGPAPSGLLGLEVS
jgi:thiamine biosynthesis lipoprotein